MLTEEQKERLKKYLQQCGIECDRSKKRMEILYYSEFNPRDFGAGEGGYRMDFQWFMRSINNSCIEFFGQEFDWLNFQIGRKENNAELHFLKSLLWIDNPFYNG